LVDKSLELFDCGHRGLWRLRACHGRPPDHERGGKDTIVVSSTGCMEVFSTPYPETAWKVPWIHSLFENAAAVDPAWRRP